MQQHNLDVVLGLKRIFHSAKSLKKVLDKDQAQWATVKNVLVHNKDSDSNTYQGAELKCFCAETTAQVREQVVADVVCLSGCMQQHLQWSDMRMLQSVLVFFVDSQGWQYRGFIPLPHYNRFSSGSGSDEEHEDELLQEVLLAMEVIRANFRAPLTAKGVTMFSLREETESMVQYAQHHLYITAEPYQKIWYKLHVCADAHKWRNVLLLCELVFSLPFLTLKLRQFSQL